MSLVVTIRAIDDTLQEKKVEKLSLNRKHILFPVFEIT